jgi:iron complex transport system ATP-binding protein
MGVDLPGREALVNALDELARTPDAPTTVHVAHTLEELPAVSHALVLRAGEVLAMGVASEVLTSTVLSARPTTSTCASPTSTVATSPRASGRW